MILASPDPPVPVGGSCLGGSRVVDPATKRQIVARELRSGLDTDSLTRPRFRSLDQTTQQPFHHT